MLGRRTWDVGGDDCSVDCERDGAVPHRSSDDDESCSAWTDLLQRHREGRNIIGIIDWKRVFRLIGRVTQYTAFQRL